MAANKFLRCGKCLMITAVVAMLGGLAFLYSGLYPMGADVPHNGITYWGLETMRERSIARAASAIEVPNDLASSERLLKGAADYNAMCASCHLQPGKNQSDFTLGLYPAPPNLAQKGDDHGHDGGHDDNTYALQRQFWIIKHGIKASGMPSWAPGHDDERIWNMVSFLQRLPELSTGQYQVLTARSDNTKKQEH